jgi:ribosome-binding protein aMBF1 (putative translation factor)
MDREKRERLQSAGFRIGDAEDFLGLTAEERRLVELRLTVSRTVRRLREKGGVTQKQLAAKLKSSQSRVAKIEAGSSDVSLDLLFKALFATGGGVEDLTRTARRRQPAKRA